MPLTSVKLFKDVELYVGQTELKLQSAQAKLLLAYCIEQQDSLSRSVLASLFWPERNESEGLKLLRNLLNRITKALPSLLEVNRYTVQFVKTGNSIDTLELQDLSSSSSVEDWQKAMLLYRGGFLEEISEKQLKQLSEELKEWLELRRQFYQNSYVNTLHKLVHILSDSTSRHNDFELAMSYIEAWQDEEPENKRIYIHKLSLLAQQHKYDELEHQYTLLKKQPLTEQIQHDITQFYQSLDIPKDGDRTLIIEPRAVDFQRVEPQARAKATIGREQDIQKIDSLLKEHRLVSIIGIGGIGKTQITKTLVDRYRLNPSFSDGVVFVSLLLTSAAQLFNHLMRILGIYKSSQHDPKDEIIKSLYDKKLLLVLDNAEHLTKELALFLSELISQTIYVRCLVSSRMKLSITPEQVYPLSNLSVPSHGDTLESLERMPAAQLLVREAKLHSDTNSPTIGFKEIHRKNIIDLCQLSHGLPLAIEIIAANLRKTSIEDMANQPLLLENTLKNQHALSKRSLALTPNNLTPSNLTSGNMLVSQSVNQLYNQSSGQETSSFASSSIAHSDMKYSNFEIHNLNALEVVRVDERSNNSRRSVPRVRSTPRHSSLQHNSLKNCFEYSWSLLEEKHQHILAQQAIFFGGFTFHGFKEITGGNAYDLAVLINTSLIQRSASGRYTRHPLIYQFCKTKLASLPELKAQVETRHAEYFVNYALELQEYIDDYQSDAALKIEPDASNFQQAIQYSVKANNLTMIEPLVLVLTGFLAIQGRYQEAISLCEEVMQYNIDENKNTVIEFFLQLWITFFHSQAGNEVEAGVYLERIEETLTFLMEDTALSNTIAEYQQDIPYYLGIYELVKGMHLDNQSLYTQAQEHFKRAIELQKPFLKTHSSTTSILARNRLGLTYVYLGKLDQAKALFEENLEYGDYFLQSLDTICLGDILMHQNDPKAEEKLLEGLELSTQKNMPLVQGFAHQFLGLYYIKHITPSQIKNQEITTEETKKVLYHLDTALTFARKMSEHRIASYTLSAGYAEFYIKTEQWFKAQECLYESLELARDCSAKLRMLSSFLRLATMDLYFDFVSEEDYRLAVTCLELVKEHQASHFIDKDRAKLLLEKNAKGQLQQHTLSLELQQYYQQNRNPKLVKNILEILNTNPNTVSKNTFSTKIS